MILLNAHTLQAILRYLLGLYCTDNQMENTKIIWKFNDGKPGHENQSNGLVAALSKVQEVQVFEVQTVGFLTLLFCWLIRKIPSTFPTLMPDLIVGAGRKTHLPMVVAKSLCGGKTVVLMRPSLPSTLFDLIVAPEHDGVPPNDNVVEIKGVLNAVPFVASKDTNNGLILIGGVSSHYSWDSQAIIDQITKIVEYDKEALWVLTTSRRTPEDFIQLLHDCIPFDNMTVVQFEDTDQDWMMKQFSRAGQIWVTPDSVSMVYEALSSGAAVMVFSLDSLHPVNQSRVVKGLNDLIEQSYISTFNKWNVDPSSIGKPKQFNETEKVAKIVLEQLS